MNKFLYALRSIGITIVGVVVAVLVTSGLHLLFALFLEDLPVEDLLAADWAGRTNVMESYMAANPFAIYSMLIAHSFGSALAVYWYVRATKIPSWRSKKGIKPYTGAVVLLALWIWGDVQNDLYDVPVGVLWTTIDVVVTVALTALAFVIAGGLRKHEGTERVSTEDGVYRG